jgi:hypothetical protein
MSIRQSCQHEASSQPGSSGFVTPKKTFHGSSFARATFQDLASLFATIPKSTQVPKEPPVNRWGTSMASPLRLLTASLLTTWAIPAGDAICVLVPRTSCTRHHSRDKHFHCGALKQISPMARLVRSNGRCPSPEIPSQPNLHSVWRPSLVRPLQHLSCLSITHHNANNVPANVPNNAVTVQKKSADRGLIYVGAVAHHGPSSLLAFPCYWQVASACLPNDSDPAAPHPWLDFSHFS